MAESTVVVLVFEDEKAAERLFTTLQETLKVAAFPVDNAAVGISLVTWRLRKVRHLFSSLYESVTPLARQRS